MHRHALGLQLARDRLNKRPVQPAPGQLATEADEGGALRCGLVAGEAAGAGAVVHLALKIAQAGSIIGATRRLL